MSAQGLASPATTPGASRRRLALGLAAAATLAASIWALTDEGDASGLERVPPTRSAAAAGNQPGPPAAEAAAVLSLPDRAAAMGGRRNLFAATAAPVPAAPPPQESAPPPPPVITLPFTFGGRLVTAAGASVLLNTGALTQVLALGATWGDFRFEQDSGSQLEFIHVPSGERLVLPIQP
jgi:hypothetical protein